MRITPPEHVKEQIDNGILPEGQWLLFAVASDAHDKAISLELSNNVTIFVGAVSFNVCEFGLDVMMPGVIFASDKEGQQYFIDWKSVTAIRVRG